MSYSPPMIGKWELTVHEARPYEIHGDKYFEMVVEPADLPGKGLKVRVPVHAVKAGRVALPARAMATMLMGQITELAFVAGEVAGEVAGGVLGTAVRDVAKPQDGVG